MNLSANPSSSGPSLRETRSSSRLLAQAGQAYADAADAAALESARLVVIDSLACAAAAADSVLGGQLIQKGDAGDYPSDTGAATIANLSHLEEFDCLHDASATAPGIVVAAVMYAGLHANSSTEEVLRAIVAGVEVVAQSGAALDSPAMYESGYWPTSLCAKLGVAAAVSRVMGLDETAAANAIAIAAITGPSLLPREICDAYYLSSGIAVDLGIRSAHWAARGLSAHDPILDDGPFVAAPETLDISGDLAPQVTHVAFKRYPCARPLHAVIDAIQQLISQAHVKASDVTGMTVSLPSGVVHFINRDTEPVAEVLRRSSLDYVVGLALIDRAADPSAYRNPLVNRYAVPVDLEIGDGEVEAMYPAHWSARVTLRVGDEAHTVLQSSAASAHPSGQPIAWLTDKWHQLSHDTDWLDRLLHAPLSAPVAAADPLEIVKAGR